MLAAGRRPVLLRGALVAACAWDIAGSWPRIVLPDAPDKYRLDFARGLDWLVLARVGHPQEHVGAVVAALREAGANIVAPVILPKVEQDEVDVVAPELLPLLDRNDIGVVA